MTGYFFCQNSSKKLITNKEMIFIEKILKKQEEKILKKLIYMDKNNCDKGEGYYIDLVENNSVQNVGFAKNKMIAKWKMSKLAKKYRAKII